MVKIYTRWKIAQELNLLRGSNIWTKTKYFWRKGWIEIPVVMGSTLLTVVGASMTCYVLWYGITHDQTPKYYRTPRIFRPDDPNVQKIRHTSIFD